MDIARWGEAYYTDTHAAIENTPNPFRLLKTQNSRRETHRLFALAMSLPYYCDTTGGTNIWFGQPYFLVVVHEAIAATVRIRAAIGISRRNLMVICIHQNYE